MVADVFFFLFPERNTVFQGDDAQTQPVKFEYHEEASIELEYSTLTPLYSATGITDYLWGILDK